jgi:hypothetical protein
MKRHTKCAGHDMANVASTEAHRLDPKDADAYLKRGSVYGQSGEYDESIADFTQAI